MVITGTSGACRLSASAIARVSPQQHSATQPVAVASGQVVEGGALGLAAGDPDHQFASPGSAASAACGLVALESST